MLFFTSDTHFGHVNIIQYENRPFTSVDEMDKTIIQRWNSVVRKSDDIWFLGDFCFSKNPAKYLSQLNGHIHLVCGNHDDDTRKIKGFASIQDYKYLRFEGHRIVLSHYPMLSWRNSHKGSIHLHGHCHGSLPHFNGKRLDVGCMTSEYYPLNLEKIISLTENKPITIQHGEMYKCRKN